MELISHKCIKCSAIYQDEEVDNYLCELCLSEKNKIAKGLDGKYNTTGQTPNSDFQTYEAFRKANGSNFVKASDLGIKLSQE